MQLVPTNNKEDFITQLNKATAHNQMPVTPILKFNGEIGEWQKETDLRNEEDKPIYKGLGNSIKFHLITTRKMVQSMFDSDLGYYSREFQDNYLEVFNQNKEVIFKGFYNDLKQSNLYNDLQFVQVLYVYYENKPYRVRLTGSKLSKLFSYLSSFRKDNPAMFETVSSAGQQLQKGSVKYYELNFSKGDEIPQETIIKRVNDINQYLSVYSQAVQNQTTEETQDDYSQVPVIEDNEEVISTGLPEQTIYE